MDTERGPSPPPKGRYWEGDAAPRWGVMLDLARRTLFLGGVALHIWTAWIAWTAKGLFAGLFTLTVPVLGEAVWGGWLIYQARSPWIPYVQVLVGYILLLIAYGIWERRSSARLQSG